MIINCREKERQEGTTPTSCTWGMGS